MDTEGINMRDKNARQPDSFRKEQGRPLVAEVVEFLSNVPLLQTLPASSLEKIPEIAVFKRYGKGEYVVHKDQVWNGVYLIWEGEAEVSGSFQKDDVAEFILKRYDYFGRGISGYVHSADVIALSELTCLVFPHEHCTSLETSIIWHSETEPDSSSLLENIMHLEPLGLNSFRGITPPKVPVFRQVFGGQIIAQALVAASKTVDPMKVIHSLHSYFLVTGDHKKPFIYEVQRLRDGNSFSSRRVDALQNGKVVFTLLASFQKEEEGFSHQESMMPMVPDPNMLIAMEKVHVGELMDPLIPRSVRNKAASNKIVAWPIEFRFCEPFLDASRIKSPPRSMRWFRARGKLSDDQTFHRNVVAYASDSLFASVSFNPHRREWRKIEGVSLDHSIWFHRPVRADDWLLFEVVSPAASFSRGFVTGNVYNRNGELVASIMQQSVMRVPRPPQPKPEPEFTSRL